VSVLRGVVIGLLLVAANGFFSLETPFAGAVTGRGIVEALRMG
jgi:hypothetical protein